MKSFLKKNKIHVMSSFIMLSFVSYYSFPKKNNEISKILKDDISSKTVMSVSKKISKHWDNEKINVYENEKKWLKILENTEIIAKPIQFDDENRIITTEYVGEKINKKNLPKDWEKQRDIIIKTLKDNNCSHNDIKPDASLAIGTASVKEGDGKYSKVTATLSVATTQPVKVNLALSGTASSGDYEETPDTVQATTN